MLQGKNIILGVSSSIACYKSAYLARALIKKGANVQVVMTKNATQFLTPLTFEQLTGRKCLVDTFDRNFEIKVEHISLAQWADACLIAPASANVLAKMAHGIADDMLTTTVLACDCPKLAAPAMNTRMYENPATRENLETLRRHGFTLVEPEEGFLACGDVGKGKLANEEVILDYLEAVIGAEKDFNGQRVLVTAGPTREALDPVRFLTNHSTGKMGYAIAKAAFLRGAKVTLVTGKTETPKPRFVDVVEVVSARQMYEAVMSRASEQDILIMAAAVADYRPQNIAAEKIKKMDGDSVLPLERTDDILASAGAARRPGQFLCGFSMETEHMLENSRKKLEKKNIDMIVANNLRQEGAGFGVDTNIVTLITKDSEESLPMLSKDEVAMKILDAIAARIKE
ncbi:bifunctional phosphopantothenoylcysteine decarboxylase/phosphopantothenate--cysteine ligase CoaBC [Cuneatibacter sp. NSJ-177]|uniref:bifunctional phosphopantothenoylcysteine decarboxylase/phosphopantothenate--cysteine ligase CoaBC n=1 Tax=Cuneatibacter sp. NSJ-177 TaxID=2931401 RepID=UPI001FD1E2B1|nr:bifunctional phosphopantothenoylcysteine decarboxylase/phosphopantothenate--cysteine ligase CoaBC [Cuneatibacter sp. NSJ-177]MCJ7836365.1 bifunctional phosphopantothenoylcysteine decarboxylase/phosphopantothenate--cysteine ligase CoaBC [Cuneatibacter sp. NSJ-177]